jgi:hypothetical protein
LRRLLWRVNSPTRGIRAEIAYAQYDEAFGGDFDYGKLSTYGIIYLPLGKKVVLGVHVDGGFNFGDAPFYDLPGLNMRGLERGRYVDDVAVLLETELRYDFADRWSAVAFGGVGRVADSVGDLSDAEDHWAGGLGFRYLIAKKYGLRMGMDVAYGDDEVTAYITVGTGWLRP